MSERDRESIIPGVDLDAPEARGHHEYQVEWDSAMFDRVVARIRGKVMESAHMSFTETRNRETGDVTFIIKLSKEAK